MSDPNDLLKNHLKRKFEELPDQVMIADRPRNKRRGVHDLVLPDKYQPESGDGGSINIARPSSAPPTLITPYVCAADIDMPVTSKIFLIFLPKVNIYCTLNHICR